jgi:hypothetical protein
LIGNFTEEVDTSVNNFTKIMKTKEQEDPIKINILRRACFKTEDPPTDVNTSATTHHRATFKIHHRATFKTQDGFPSSYRAAFQMNVTIVPPGVHATMFTQQSSMLVSIKLKHV